MFQQKQSRQLLATQLKINFINKKIRHKNTIIKTQKHKKHTYYKHVYKTYKIYEIQKTITFY